MKLGTKEIPALRLGAAAVLKAYLGGSQVWPLGFDLAALFAQGEPGVWYDPSDLSTLFQDSAGTTPVTAVEQPVGLMLDKSKGLALGPELVTNGGFTTDANWAKGIGWAIGSGQASIDGSQTGLSELTQANVAVVAGSTSSITTNTFTTTGSKVYRAGGSGYLYTVTFDVVSLSGQIQVFVGSASTRNFRFVAAAGTTAVIDNVSVKITLGNHAYQTTATSRPVLSARYNLLTKTEQFDDAAWTANGGNVSVVSGQTDPFGGTTASKIVENTANGPHYILQKSGAQFLSGVSYKLSFYGKGNGRYLRFSLEKEGAGGLGMVVDLSSGVLLGNVSNAAPGIYVSSAISASENGFYRVEFVITTSQTGSWNVAFLLSNTNSLVWAPTYTGDGTSGIYIWGTSLVPANQSSLPYQRVNTATDYDADPAKFPHYLRFDGVDDWMVTNTITPGIDKAQVFAGVRKLSDAAMVFWEHGNNQAGGFVQGNYSDGGQTLDRYNFWSRGSTTLGFAWSGGYPAPTTNALTGIGDISGDSAILRVNGTQAAISTRDQGTGNYGNYPLYIGRRGGTSLPFNGHLYSLIVRFGSNLPIGTIEKTEKYINTKTGAY